MASYPLSLDSRSLHAYASAPLSASVLALLVANAALLLYSNLGLSVQIVANADLTALDPQRAAMLQVPTYNALSISSASPLNSCIPSPAD